MKWYAELDPVRTRQMTRDAIAAGLIIAFIVLGVLVYELLSVAAVPGAAIQNAGDAVGSVPGFGGVGATLSEAGRSFQGAVLKAAFWMAVGTAAIGIAAVAVIYLPGRLQWVHEAAAAAQLRDGSASLQLLAYRAVARRPLSRLSEMVPDPGAALASGDYEQLANLELEELGLRQASRKATP